MVEFITDRSHGIPDDLLRFANHFDQDKASRACTATKQAFNNIEALKHALDSGMTSTDEAIK